MVVEEDIKAIEEDIRVIREGIRGITIATTTIIITIDPIDDWSLIIEEDIKDIVDDLIKGDIIIINLKEAPKL